MRVIPPLMILLMLLATSLLAVIPTSELNETASPMMVETTEYEVAFLTILEPSEGHVYRSGEAVGMRILVANLGTQTVTDLQVEVELWKSEVGANETLEDSWQLQDTWTEVAVCSDCFEKELETATLLGGYGFDLSTIQWFAESGHYRFITRVISSQDTDPTNNEYTVDFGVYQAFDVATRAYWDATGVDVMDLSDGTISSTCPSEPGTCYDFNLNVSYAMLNQFETPEFEIRDIEVELTVSNAGVTEAYLIDSKSGTQTAFYDDSMGAESSKLILSEQIGKAQKVVVGYTPSPQGDDLFETTDTRYVAEMGTSTDFQGRIKTDGTNHGFQVKAEVVGFKLWQNVTISYQCIVSNQDRGLPDGVMGNSEVGHMNIGSGRIVEQDLVRINSDIQNNEMINNKNLISCFESVKKNNSRLHLLGLLSDGGVHSHIEHLKHLLNLAKINNIKSTFIHVITDGRDTSPDSGIGYLEDLQKHINKINYGEIGI